jgi:hypothetical protein
MQRTMIPSLAGLCLIIDEDFSVGAFLGITYWL